MVWWVWSLSQRSPLCPLWGQAGGPSDQSSPFGSELGSQMSPTEYSKSYTHLERGRERILVLPSSPLSQFLLSEWPQPSVLLSRLPSHIPLLHTIQSHDCHVRSCDLTFCAAQEHLVLTGMQALCIIQAQQYNLVAKELCHVSKQLEAKVKTNSLLPCVDVHDIVPMWKGAWLTGVCHHSSCSVHSHLSCLCPQSHLTHTHTHYTVLVMQ